jgi:hypothetical protein
MTTPLHIQLILTKLFLLYLSQHPLTMMMAAPHLSFLSIHTMLTLTPEGKVPGSLRETGPGL